MESKGEIWQDFIRKEIVPTGLMSEPPRSADMASYVQRSAHIREGFIDAMMAEAIVPRDAGQLNVLISGYQALLCFLLDHVHEYRHQTQQHPRFVRLYDAATADLETGLQFLQHYFPKQFDQKALVPAPLLEAFRKVDEWRGYVMQTSPATSEEDGYFGELVLSELKTFSLAPIRFYQLSYMKGFLQGLPTAGIPGYRQPIPISALAEYCIVKNFNSLAVVQWFFTRFAENLSAFETGDEKREWLRNVHTYLYRLPIEQEYELYAQRLAVRDYLVTWVEQELVVGQADQKRETMATMEIVPKINTSVSVPVLALLTRVLKEAGVITNTNLQELFRSISANYTSQRTESISPANFHGKYYTVEENTKRKVTDLLLELVKMVRKIP